ncbi:MAG: ribonuclease PH [Candidatus Babeliales bacterium]|jgi:ribonuclease PH
MTSFRRADNRASEQIRPVSIQYDVFGCADASILYEQGNTKVLVGVTLQPMVPPFLKGQRTGWLSAEYAMLPTATKQRTQRESSQNQRNARSVEISRLIGRCLRTTINLASLGERSIYIDCDVLQADGGTRTACITAASLALELACQRWHAAGVTTVNVFKEQLAAISVGVVQGIPLVDLVYSEDSNADADFNFVFTKHMAIVEIQGTSEKTPVSNDCFDQIKNLAIAGTKDLFAQCQLLASAKIINQPFQEKQSPFSLGARLGKNLETRQ